MAAWEAWEELHALADVARGRLVPRRHRLAPDGVALPLIIPDRRGPLLLALRGRLHDGGDGLTATMASAPRPAFDRSGTC